MNSPQPAFLWLCLGLAGVQQQVWCRCRAGVWVQAPTTLKCPKGPCSGVRHVKVPVQNILRHSRCWMLAASPALKPPPHKPLHLLPLSHPLLLPPS